MAQTTYSRNVFVNCPFDDKFQPLFRAIVFSISDCGFIPRCALEIDDGSQVRIDKIFKIIGECKFGIHDISRTDLDTKTRLPRFNMPLELGMFLATKKFGSGKQRKKNCLIVDTTKHRYRKFISDISDISGQDVQAHGNSQKKVISVVRDWLRASTNHAQIPGGAEIHRQFKLFVKELPDLCRELRLKEPEMTFTDYAHLVSAWLDENTLDMPGRGPTHLLAAMPVPRESRTSHQNNREPHANPSSAAD